MSKISKTNLGYLGEDFQYKLVSTFMFEPNFFKELYSIIDQNVFTVPQLKTYVGIMKEYYNKYGSVPTYSIMGIKLREKAFNEIDIETYDAINSKLKSLSSEGVDEVKDMSGKFFKQQNLIKAAHEIIKIAGDGNYEKYPTCLKLVEDAITIDDGNDKWTTPLSNLDETLSEEFCISIPTGIEGLDEMLDGGLDKGKVGLIIGSAGFGKTTISTAISSAASTTKNKYNDFSGFKVLHIFFEDDVRDIKRKYISRITQVEARNLSKDEETVDKVKQAISQYQLKDMLDNNVKMVRFKTNAKTVGDINNYIKKLINEGFRPDLVIIDYFDCLVPEKGYSPNESEWSREGKTMRALENMAHDLNVAIWLPTQGGRDSINADLVTMDKVGGSIKKGQIAQVVVTITRTLSDIEHNIATIAVIKNRAGRAGGVMEDTEFNNGTSTIRTKRVYNFDNDPQLLYNDTDQTSNAKNFFK